MSFSPSPLQTLFLWRLVVNGGSDFWKYVKPQPSAKERKALVTAGFITEEKRREPGKDRSPPSLYLSVSEAGWHWAATHLDAAISTRTPATGPILQAILRKLKTHLAKTNTSLADFICPIAQADAEPALDLPTRVRQGYLSASGGQWRVRVRLADLHRALADVSVQRLHAALLAMEREGSVVLYPLDDPQEIRPDDTAVALPNSLGAPRHVLYIER